MACALSPAMSSACRWRVARYPRAHHEHEKNFFASDVSGHGRDALVGCEAAGDLTGDASSGAFAGGVAMGDLVRLGRATSPGSLVEQPGGHEGSCGRPTRRSRSSRGSTAGDGAKDGGHSGVWISGGIQRWGARHREGARWVAAAGTGVRPWRPVGMSLGRTTSSRPRARVAGCVTCRAWPGDDDV